VAWLPGSISLGPRLGSCVPIEVFHDGSGYPTDQVLRRCAAQSDHSIRGRSLGPDFINATTSSALATRPPQASMLTLICLPDCSQLSWTCPWTNHSPVSTGRSVAYRRTSVESPLCGKWQARTFR